MINEVISKNYTHLKLVMCQSQVGLEHVNGTHTAKGQREREKDFFLIRENLTIKVEI